MNSPRCPRCNGCLVRGYDEYGDIIASCLSCGWDEPTPPGGEDYIRSYNHGVWAGRFYQGAPHTPPASTAPRHIDRGWDRDG